MNTHIIKICKQMGLRESESKVFSSLLVFGGKSKVSALVETLGMNRATVYHTLLCLEQKGLIYKQMVNGCNEYLISDANSIDAFFNNEVRGIEAAKENVFSVLKLFQKKKISSIESNVRIFQGEEAVKSAFEIVFQSKKREWSVIAPKDNFLTHVDEIFVERYIKKRKGVITKTLWETSIENPILSKAVAKERNVKYLPKEFSKKFSSLIILFDNSVLFVNSYEEQKATIITSGDIVSTLQVLFDFAWRNGVVPQTR